MYRVDPGDGGNKDWDEWIRFYFLVTSSTFDHMKFDLKVITLTPIKYTYANDHEHTQRYKAYYLYNSWPEKSRW